MPVDLSDLSHSYPFLHLSRLLGVDYGDVLKVVRNMDRQIRQASCGVSNDGLVRWSDEGLTPEVRLLIAKVCQAPWRWDMSRVGERGL
jgi:hypothetical protein